MKGSPSQAQVGNRPLIKFENQIQGSAKVIKGVKGLKNLKSGAMDLKKSETEHVAEPIDLDKELLEDQDYI